MEGTDKRVECVSWGWRRGRGGGDIHPVRVVPRGDSQRSRDKASLQRSEEMSGKHLEILSVLPDE